MGCHPINIRMASHLFISYIDWLYETDKVNTSILRVVLKRNATQNLQGSKV